jgi:hypothetical protein
VTHTLENYRFWCATADHFGISGISRTAFALRAWVHIHLVHAGCEGEVRCFGNRPPAFSADPALAFMDQNDGASKRLLGRNVGRMTDQ